MNIVLKSCYVIIVILYYIVILIGSAGSGAGAAALTPPAPRFPPAAPRGMLAFSSYFCYAYQNIERVGWIRTRSIAYVN